MPSDGASAASAHVRGLYAGVADRAAMKATATLAASPISNNVGCMVSEVWKHGRCVCVSARASKRGTSGKPVTLCGILRTAGSHCSGRGKYVHPAAGDGRANTSEAVNIHYSSYKYYTKFAVSSTPRTLLVRATVAACGSHSEPEHTRGLRCTPHNGVCKA